MAQAAFAVAASSWAVLMGIAPILQIRRMLLELRAMIRPSEDLTLYRADMAGWERAERGELPGWRELDATADRKAGVLRVDAIHQDVPFTKATTTAVTREIKALATWLDLGLDMPQT